MTRPTFGTIDDDGSVRRQGRPALPDHAKLSAEQRVRYTRPSFEDVCRAAREVGVAPAVFARQAVLAHARKVIGGADQ